MLVRPLRREIRMACCRSVVVLPVLLFGTGCADDLTCPAWSFPAVQVNLKSSVSGSPILGALGEVQDGEYRDSLVDLGDGTYMAAENNPGTYSVRVESSGYSPWDTTGVHVEQVGGACPTVETEILEAGLEPTT
jgi:hypothetical protein